MHGRGKIVDVVRLHNQSNWEISGLDISNTTPGFTNPSVPNALQGDKLGDFRGIHITGAGGGTLERIRLHDLNVHDVTGWLAWIGFKHEQGGGLLADGAAKMAHGVSTMGTGWDFSKRTGGIVFETLDGATPTTFNAITVENCDLQRNSFAGITFSNFSTARLAPTGPHENQTHRLRSMPTKTGSPTATLPFATTASIKVAITMATASI